MLACLAEERDWLLLQLLRVADVAVDDAVKVQTCKGVEHDDSEQRLIVTKSLFNSVSK